MDEKALQLKLDELKIALEGKLDEKTKTEVEKQLKAIQEKLLEVKSLTDKVTELEKNAIANQKALDDLIIKSKEPINIHLNGQKGFDELLGDALNKKADNLKRGNFKGFELNIDKKVVGNMASSANLTGSYFVPPTLVPGVNVRPYESQHVRDFIPIGSTNSNVVRYLVDNGGEGGPAMVAEAGTKPQIDRDIEIKDAPVRKMATYFRVPEEMIEDIPYLQSFLGQIGLEEVMVVEDNQLLYGDGTGQNISGLNALGTAFAAGTSVIGASANEYDVIGASKKQLRIAKFGGPLIAFVNPNNYYDMRYKRKDTTNNYIFQAPSLNPLDSSLQADGVRIFEHTSVVNGDFFVFSPRVASIFDRAGTTVRFYDQDQDNAIKNLITIVIEKRLAFVVYYPAGVIRGTFATAITDLTT